MTRCNEAQECFHDDDYDCTQLIDQVRVQKWQKLINIQVGKRRIMNKSELFFVVHYC